MPPIMKVAIPAAACVLALLAAPAQATLIGDTVSVEYQFPDLGTIFESHLTVVEAGTGDVVDFFAGDHQVDVNVEASSVEIDWIINIINFQPGNFNGIVVTDLDFQGQPAPLIGIDITTNAQGWNDAFASFTEDSIALNFEPLGSVPQFSMVVDLIFRQAAPEPTSIGLIALGLAGLVLRARRNPR
jgi:hypothetical protein